MQPTPSKAWRALESLPGIGAVQAEWRQLASGDFPGLAAGLLQKTDRKAGSFPCPRECGCRHRVVRHDTGKIVAICDCESWNCDDLVLTEADLEVYELSWGKLGRGIARAFGCDFGLKDLGLRATRQVATFSGASLPVIITLQAEDSDFRATVAELAAGLRRPFVLLAPTGRAVDVRCLELLANVNAGFFALEGNVTILPSGALQARRTAGELFSPFVPAEKDAATDGEAARIFALLKKLDAGPKARKAPLDQVFRLLVLEGRSKDEVARALGCAASLVTLRVQAIEECVKRPVEELQILANRLVEMDAAAKDPRARTLYRAGLEQDEN